LRHLFECARASALFPRSDDRGRVAVHGKRRVDLEIVASERMRRLEIRLRVAEGAIAAGALAPLELDERAVNSDAEDVEVPEEIHEPQHPAPRLDDMFDDEIVSGLGQCGDAAVKSLEEGGAHLCPREFACVDALLRQHVRRDQVVDREVPERLVEAACSARASVDLPELDAPLRKMILPQRPSIRAPERMRMAFM
jgi:hypothetical protein